MRFTGLAAITTLSQIIEAATSVSPSLSLALAKPNLAYDAIRVENFGYSGHYFDVEAFSDIDTDECSCTLSTDETHFSGVNAPINEEVSVHFRGPLILHQFAYYVAEDFILGDPDHLANWSRLLYYDAADSVAQNVTFMTGAGTNSTCLGNAITYLDSDGISALSNATVLAQDTLISSDEEYIIFSNVSCADASGSDGDCGFYRDGIPLYHGFYGDTKMFLFEFEMPSEDVVTVQEVYNYDMPLIWLLNAKIPRTSQYPTSTNCSCWTSGCGEFDIFEALNTTESNHLYSTIHDYQGTGYIQTGLSLYGYIPRDTTGVMRGGVVFDSNGTLVVFLSNDTSIDSTVAGSALNNWLQGLDEVEDTLDSVSSSNATFLHNSWIMAGLLVVLNLLISW